MALASCGGRGEHFVSAPASFQDAEQSSNAGGSFAVLHTFAGPPNDGQESAGAPIVTAAGDVFDTTGVGGLNQAGTAFEFTHLGTFKILHNFGQTATDGALPGQAMVLNAGGSLTVTTAAGGTNNEGSIERIDPSGAGTVLHSFSVTDGAGPQGVIADSAGELFGVTSLGGNNSIICHLLGGCGTVFEFDPKTGKLNLRHVFHLRDGALPLSRLVRDVSGNLYGTAEAGGSAHHPCQLRPGIAGCGVVFKIDPAGTYRIVHDFNLTDGEFPLSLTGTPQAQLYGTTFKGGANNLGVVFAIDASGKETTLHSFTGGADGEFPSGLTLHGGKLFGFAAAGGAGSCACGTVFEIDPATKHLTTLHTFNGADGEFPSGTLAVDANGGVIGTTSQGGNMKLCNNAGCGTLFRIRP